MHCSLPSDASGTLGARPPPAGRNQHLALVSPTPAATTASVLLAPALMDSQNRRFSSRFGKRMQRLLTGWLLQRLPELKVRIPSFWRQRGAIRSDLSPPA